MLNEWVLAFDVFTDRGRLKFFLHFITGVVDSRSRFTNVVVDPGD